MRHLIRLGAILALALFLRLYHVGEQSLWMDESGVFFNLNAPNLTAYLDAVQLLIPEQTMAPLYYIFQYFWAHCTGMSLSTLRVPPIAIGMIALVVIYLVGKYLYSPKAGLVAALCLAVSPQHIWYDQEIRNYALTNLLAVVSIYALLRAVYDGPLGGSLTGKTVRKWWILCLAANTLLVLTHILAALLILVEGLFLLLFVRRHFRTVLTWGVLQWLLLIPSLCLIAYAPFKPAVPSPGVSWRDYVAAVMEADLVSAHTDLLPSWKTASSELRSPAENRLLRPHYHFDAVLRGVLACGLFWHVAPIIGALWSRIRKKQAVPNGYGKQWQVCLFLLMLIVVPASVLGILENTLHRFLMNPMYAMYNGIGLYLGIGALISVLPFVGIRMLATAALLAAYGYQLLIFLPDATRTNWRGTAQYIQAHAQPRDRVIDVLCHDGIGQILGYYLSGTSYDIRLVKTFQAACDDALDFFASVPPNQRGVTGGSVWVAYSNYPIIWFVPPPGVTTIPEALRFTETRPLEVLRAGCAARGLRVEERTFHGHFNVVLCRITSDTAIKPEMKGAPVEGVTPVDYDAALEDLGLDTHDPERTAGMTAALRRNVPKWPPTDTILLLWHGADLLVDKELELSEAIARFVIRTRPEFGAAHFLLGLNFVMRGDDRMALDEFDRAYALHRGLARLFGPYIDALCVKHSMRDADAELARLDVVGFEIFLSALHRVHQTRFPVPADNEQSRASTKER